MDFLLMLCAIGVLSVIFIFKDHLKYKERKEVNDLSKDSISYNSHTDTLTIQKRDCNISKILEIVPYKRVKYGETPEKLVYTGATVGGVTTGGWHKTGGFYGQDVGKSGKVQLVYFKESENKMIPSEVKKIVLSESVLKEAKSSSIKEYLDGNTIVIMREPANTDAAVAAMKLGHKDYAFNIMEDAKIAALPTYEKCRAIIDWLSDVAPSVGQQKTTNKTAVNKKPIIIGCIVVAVLLGSILGYNVYRDQKQKAHEAAECQDLYDAITIGAPQLGISDLEITSVEYAVDGNGNRTSYLVTHANSDQFGQLSYEEMVVFYRSLDYHATDYNPDLSYFAQCIMCDDETDGLRIHSGGHEYKCSYEYNRWALYEDGMKVYEK